MHLIGLGRFKHAKLNLLLKRRVATEPGSFLEVEVDAEFTTADAAPVSSRTAAAGTTIGGGDGLGGGAAAGDGGGSSSRPAAAAAARANAPLHAPCPPAVAGSPPP